MIFSLFKIGAAFSEFINRLFKSKQLNCSIIGLQNSGKTTFTNLLSNNIQEQTIPTIGFNFSVAKQHGLQISIFDVSGQQKFRNLWERYCVESACILYMVDASDRQKIEESREELMQVLQNENMAGKPILVLANKSDLPTSLKLEEIIQQFQLNDIKNRDVSCYSISAKEKKNIEPVLKWMQKYAE